MFGIQHAGIQQTALIAAFKPPFRWVHELRAAITAAIAASVSHPLYRRTPKSNIGLFDKW